MVQARIFLQASKEEVELNIGLHYILNSSDPLITANQMNITCISQEIQAHSSLKEFPYKYSYFLDSTRKHTDESLGFTYLLSEYFSNTQ